MGIEIHMDRYHEYMNNFLGQQFPDHHRQAIPPNVWNAARWNIVKADVLTGLCLLVTPVCVGGFSSQMASDPELCFLCYQHELAVEQTGELPVIWCKYSF